MELNMDFNGQENQFHQQNQQNLQIKRYREQIRNLEDSVYSLRMSRRILMSLLEQVQSNSDQELERLRKQNSILQKQNHNYAQRIWQQNRHLLELGKDC